MHQDPDGKDKTRLANLRTELEKLKKAKDDYVKEHPEQRKLVYGGGRPRGEDEASTSGPSRKVGAERNLFGKDGLPLHPERSIWYDPVLNPSGLPPPGQLYMERRKFSTNALTSHLLSLLVSHAFRCNGRRRV